MLFGSKQKLKQQSLQLLMNGSEIKYVTSTKYLGLYIDSNLSWSIHSEYILKKIRSRSNILLRLRPLPSQLLFKLYRAFISPIYEYCDIVWQPPLIYTRQLDNFHKRIMQKIKANSVMVQSTPSIRRTFHTALQVYKITNRLCPTYLYDTIKYAIEISKRPLQNQHRLYVPSIRTNIGKDSFYYKCTQVWNHIKPVLYTSDSIRNFKNDYKLLYNIV